MSILPQLPRTDEKRCFMFCGERCTCAAGRELDMILSMRDEEPALIAAKLAENRREGWGGLG